MQQDKLYTKNFISLTLANLFMAIAFYFMTPIMALFMKDRFDANESEIGLAMFCFTIAAIGMRPYAGYLLDTISRYLFYVMAFVTFMLLFLGYPIAYSFAFLLVLRFIHGLTWGAMNTAANTLAVDFTPEKRRGEGLGFFGVSMNVAMAISPMLALYISGKYGYNNLFYSAVIFCIVGLLFVSMFRTKIKERKKVAFSFHNLFEKKALPISLNIMIFQISYGGIISFIALYGRHIGIANGGTFFLLLALSIAVSRILSGRIFDKIGPKKITIFGALFLVIGFFILGYFPLAIGFHLSALILGLGFGVISPTFQAMVNRKVEPQRRGATNSTYLMFFDSGIGFGMMLYGFLIKKVGYSATFYISASIELLALFLFLTVTWAFYQRELS